MNPIEADIHFGGGIRQEIVVAEGTAFEVTTSEHDNHLTASGRIGRVHDEQVELVLTLKEWRNEENATRRKMHYKNLPIRMFQSPVSVYTLIAALKNDDVYAPSAIRRATNRW